MFLLLILFNHHSPIDSLQVDQWNTSGFRESKGPKKDQEWPTPCVFLEEIGPLAFDLL